MYLSESRDKDFEFPTSMLQIMKAHMRLLTRILGLIALLVLIPGCSVDTHVLTEVNEDGSLTRTFSMKLDQLEKEKEATTYPAKIYTLPSAPAWTVLDSSKSGLKVQAKVAPGQPIPGGYDRTVKILNRRSANEARLEVRDHFLAKSYRYEERYSDTIRPEEFKQSLVEEYERFAKRMQDSVAKEFGEGYELSTFNRYLNKDLHKLMEDGADASIENGLWEAAGVVAVRLALGGFPLKNANQLMNAEPRVVVQEMLRHFMRKVRTKSEDGLDAGTFDKLKHSLLTGSAEEQIEARRVLTDQGPKVLQQVANLLREQAGPDGKPATPEAKRLEEVVLAIQEQVKTKVEAFVLKFSKELEDYFLHPPPDSRDAIERTIAQVAGAHIEANFSSVDYFFEVRLKLPGEIASIDSLGKRLNEGFVGWNFNALNFCLKPLVCQARSRQWNQSRIASLSQALTGNPKTVMMKTCADIEDAVSKLETPSAERVAAAMEACSNTKNREPLTTLSLDEKAPPGAAACAKLILEKVPAAK